MEGAWSHFFLGNFSPKEMFIDIGKISEDQFKPVENLERST